MVWLLLRGPVRVIGDADQDQQCESERAEARCLSV
eukprot:COSAG06_NODE_57709_length_279_cov_0.966667_1_plen_34_part_01